MDEPTRSFTFGACLGQGGFGQVYRATMHLGSGLESQVAVKVLRSDLDAEADAMRRLRDEGRLLARLNHPNILTVYDLVRLEGQISLVTEWVDGADLDACLAADPPLSPRAVLDVIGQVASALEAAWQAPDADGQPLRIVHRDLKPSNVRIGRHGQVRLLDFGIAHFVSAEREAETASDLVVGSVPYMAPERFFLQETTHAADVFGLGCMLFEALSGERYLGRGDIRRISRVALSSEAYATYQERRLLAIADGLPQVVELVRQCLAYAHEQRPTAGEVAMICDGVEDSLPGESLRAWSRSWPVSPVPIMPGHLEGRTLREGVVPPQTLAAAGVINIIHRGLPTVDQGGGPVSQPANLLSDLPLMLDAPTLLPPDPPPRPDSKASPRPRLRVSTVAMGSGCVLMGFAVLGSVPVLAGLLGWWLGLSIP
jgi:serine/threonine protein kinase